MALSAETTLDFKYSSIRMASLRLIDMINAPFRPFGLDPNRYYLHLYNGRDIGVKEKEWQPWESLTSAQQASRRRYYLDPEGPKERDFDDGTPPTLIEEYRKVTVTPHQVLQRLKASVKAFHKRVETDYRYQDYNADKPSVQYVQCLSDLRESMHQAYDVLMQAERGIYQCALFTPPVRLKSNELRGGTKALNQYLALHPEERAAQNDRMRKESAMVANQLWDLLPLCDQLLDRSVLHATIDKPLPHSVLVGLPPSVVGRLPTPKHYPIVLKETEINRARTHTAWDEMPQDKYVLTDTNITNRAVDPGRFKLLVDMKRAYLLARSLELAAGNLRIRVPTQFVMSYDIAGAIDEVKIHHHLDGHGNRSDTHYSYKSPYSELGTLAPKLAQQIGTLRQELGLSNGEDHDRKYMAQFERAAQKAAAAMHEILQPEIEANAQIHQPLRRSDGETTGRVVG